MSEKLRLLTASDVGDITENYKSRRLVQVFWAVEAALFLLSLHQYWDGAADRAAYLLTTAVFLYPVVVFARRRQSSISAWILMLVLFALVSFFVVSYGGLNDEALLGYPSILIFAAILGSRRLFQVLLVGILAVVFSLGVLEELGIYQSVVNTGGLNSAVIISLIISVVGFSVWLMAADLRKITNRLIEENQKAHRSEEKVKQLISYDALTGLPNRLLAKDRFEHAIIKAEREGKKVACLFIDLDNFKPINDTLGHSVGDQFLIGVSNRLLKCIRQSDTLARLGGDEFLIILENIESENQVSLICSKLLRSMGETLAINENLLSSTCSIGVSMAPSDGTDFEEVIKKADTAMYYSKDQGKNGFHFFNQAMNTHAQEYLSLLSELKLALEQEQFELFYQPQIDLQSQKIVGAEALIRWNHPERGMIPPLEFIGLSEKSGFIVELSEWIIKKACSQCKEWNQSLKVNIPVAVNISPLHFKRANFEEVVKEAIVEAQIDPSDLELELTENLLVEDSVRLRTVLASLKQMGVRFSIDDFGTGYSNLGYLRRMKVEVLKIDQSFIRRLINNPEDRAIVIAIINMAKGLHLKTVAEGIETDNVVEELLGLNCDIGQGYYWSKPLAFNDFIEFVKQYPNRNAA